MRELTSHNVNTCNGDIRLTVTDDPGQGGANHRYRAEWWNAKTADNPSEVSKQCVIEFQNGPIAEVGTNGITHEVLLAVVEDRLKCFQAGPYACRENAIALTHIQDAMHWLHHRTRERLARGVEGTHQK